MVEYNLELERVAREIKRNRSKKVLIQLPDGLKLKATEIVDELERKTKAEFYIWQGSCFGACDIPQVSDSEFDLIVQFGHSAWNYNKEKNIKVLK